MANVFGTEIAILRCFSRLVLIPRSAMITTTETFPVSKLMFKEQTIPEGVAVFVRRRKFSVPTT